MTPNQDQSAVILTEALRSGEPFCYSKWGDGGIECLHQINKFDRTCDGELAWSDDDQAAVARAGWRTMRQAAARYTVYLGDWMTASDFGPNNEQKHESEYYSMLAGANFIKLHYECLLLMRLTPALLDFYRAVKEDRRKKVLVTSSIVGAAMMLDADLIRIPCPQEYGNDTSVSIARRVVDQIQDSGAEVVLFAAGGVTQYAQSFLFDEGQSNLTSITLGSGLDPLFLGRTRSVQIEMRAARDYFREML